MSDRQLIERYYDGFDEWGRLETFSGRLEFVRTMACLESFIPAESRILDLGGGPGRYAIELAQLGHEVDLADVSSELLRIAQSKIDDVGVSTRIKSIKQVNATDLSDYSDAMFDIVLALGPFYHLQEEHQRSKAAQEIFRVLKPGGCAAVAFIPHLSGVSALIDRAATDVEQVSVERFLQCAETGVFKNATERGFQEGFYSQPKEIVACMASVGFVIERMVSVRSMAYSHEAALAAIEMHNPALFSEVMTFCDQVAENPAVVATCGHALCLCRK